MIFSLVAMVLFVIVGGAMDFRGAQSREVSLQTVLDTALLSAVSQDVEWEEMPNLAQKYFDSRIDEYSENDLKYDLNLSVNTEERLLSAVLTGSIASNALKLTGINRLDLFVDSAATLGGSSIREPLCFMAMHPTRKHTLELKDSVDVFAPDCHIYGNSDHPYDVVDPHKKTNHLTGKSVQAIGYGHHYLENVTPPLEYAPELIPAPLPDMNIPGPGGCTAQSGKYNGGKHVLNPGTFCGGLQLVGNTTADLKPGVYHITGGNLNLVNSELTGAGVTLILGPNVRLNWTNSRIVLSAPDDTDLTKDIRAGIAIIGARQALTHSINRSFVDIHGLVYMLDGTFEWTNAGNELPVHKWTAWIIEGVTWRGSGTIYYNFKPEESLIPYPGALSNIIPRPGEAPHLIK